MTLTNNYLTTHTQPITWHLTPELWPYFKEHGTCPPEHLEMLKKQQEENPTPATLDLDALASDFHTGKISGEDTIAVLKETHTEDELKKLYWTICEKAGLFPGDCTMTDEENSLWELLDSTETEDYWDTEWK